MVPYTAVEFYPTDAIMGNFNNGIGQGDWEKIYLCNGSNGTPDKRGVVPVGATTGMGGGVMSAKVNPGGFNPNYSLGGGIIGDNSVTLTVGSMPSHTHTNNFAISPNPHKHSLPDVWNEGGNTHTASGGNANEGPNIDPTGFTTLSITGTIADTGGGLPHQNNQPALACYYIIYLP
jgi:microcystin-dependent protein